MAHEGQVGGSSPTRPRPDRNMPGISWDPEVFPTGSAAGFMFDTYITVALKPVPPLSK